MRRTGPEIACGVVAPGVSLLSMMDGGTDQGKNAGGGNNRREVRAIIGTGAVLAGLFIAQMGLFVTQIGWLRDDLRHDMAELRRDFGRHMDRLETRMDRLEIRMDRMETRMDGFEKRMDSFDVRLARIEERLDIGPVPAAAGPALAQDEL